MDDDPWFENAVIYAVDVEVFKDANGDGVGDFQGLIEELEYLDQLGISVLWLLPFYPTPNRDNGYDVMDYYDVDSRLGTLGDFVELVQAAEARGIRVLIDLVVNHTSDEHPWFRAARADPESTYRDYYVWVEEPPPPDPSRGSVFPGEVEDDRVWTYDHEAKAYYYHRFYPFQPDLNLANPDVRDEIAKIMTFWLELGVAGFRVDAATLMIEPKHPESETPDDPHALLRRLKRQVVDHRPDGILLAEADDEPSKLGTYFGDGDEMDMLMNFVLNAHLVAALATERAGPLAEGLARLPETPSGTWANFLRNYDELNLGRLPTALRDETFERFAPEGDMRIYGRGIRRRLATMVDGDRRRMKLAFSLLFSLPGAPMVLYGDEIGMGDELTLPGRQSIRTPMQWTDDEHGGFSNAHESDLVTPVIADDEFGYEVVNVAAQRGDSDSLLTWMRRLIATRTEVPEIGHDPYTILDPTESRVFAHRVHGADRSLTFVHNLAGEETVTAVPVEATNPDAIQPILGDQRYTLRDDGTCAFTLDPYGYLWVERAAASRSPDEAHADR